MVIEEKKVAKRFWSKVNKFEDNDAVDCWIWEAARSSAGYGRFKVNGKLESPHRMVYEWYHGEIPDGYYVCHHCDVPPCINPDHLFLGTRADNMVDAYEKGRLNLPKGEDHPFAKLRNDEVRRIKKLLDQGKSQVSIAKLFNVNKSTIQSIASGENWAHVEYGGD